MIALAVIVLAGCGVVLYTADLRSLLATANQPLETATRAPDPRRIKHVTCWSGGTVVFSVATEDGHFTTQSGYRLTDVVTGRQYVVMGTCMIE